MTTASPTPVLFYDDLQQGHFITVEYESPHSESRQQTAGEIHDVDIKQGHAVVGLDAFEKVEIVFTDGSATVNADWGDANRRLTLMFEDGDLWSSTLEARNGGRWHRLEALGGEDLQWQMYTGKP